MKLVHQSEANRFSRRTALKLLGGAVTATAFGSWVGRVGAAGKEPIKVGLSAAFYGPNA
jgi:hypothetical protein